MLLVNVKKRTITYYGERSKKEGFSVMGGIARE